MISIIIPYFKSKETIYPVVDQIIHFLSQEKTDYEIILINDGDNSSDDILRKIQLLKNVTIITNSQNSGPAFCRNLGVQNSKGDILVFLDSDMLINENTIRLIIQYFSNPENQKTVLVGVYSKDTCYKNFYSIHYNQRIRYGFISNINSTAPPINAGMFSLKRDIYETVGGFWSKFKSASVEDIELGKRFEKNGFRITILPELSMCHLRYMSLVKHLINDFKRSRDRCEFLFDLAVIHNICNGKGFEYTKNNYLISAILCLFFWISIIVSFKHPKVFLLSISLTFCMTYLNRSMFAFFKKECGSTFTLKAVLFQFLDLLFAMIGVVLGIVRILFEQLFLSFKDLLNLFIRKKNPISIVHFVTEVCNLNCGHCFIEKSSIVPKEYELSTDEFDKVSFSFNKYLKNVIITGGEPFLRKDLSEICLSYANNTSIKTILIPTNGWFVDELKIFIDTFHNKCRRDSVRVYFVISLDGPREIHDRLRAQNGLYEKALAFYDCIKSYNNPMFIPNIQLTITDLNYSYADDFYDYLHNELKIKNVNINLIRREGRITCIKNKDQIYKVYEKLNDKISKDLKKDFYTFRPVERFTRILSLMRSQLQVKIYHHKLFPGTCPAGGLFLTIRPNGDVYPCEMLKEKSGNLREAGYNINNILLSKENLENISFIKEHKCSCTYECALVTNIMSQCKLWIVWSFKYISFLMRFRNYKAGE